MFGCFLANAERGVCGLGAFFQDQDQNCKLGVTRTDGAEHLEIEWYGMVWYGTPYGGGRYQYHTYVRDVHMSWGCLMSTS